MLDQLSALDNVCNCTFLAVSWNSDFSGYGVEKLIPVTVLNCSYGPPVNVSALFYVAYVNVVLLGKLALSNNWLAVAAVIISSSAQMDDP